jgi:hypothetical protein
MPLPFFTDKEQEGEIRLLLEDADARVMKVGHDWASGLELVVALHQLRQKIRRILTPDQVRAWDESCLTTLKYPPATQPSATQPAGGK